MLQCLSTDFGFLYPVKLNSLMHCGGNLKFVSQSSPLHHFTLNRHLKHDEEPAEDAREKVEHQHSDDRLRDVEILLLYHYPHGLPITTTGIHVCRVYHHRTVRISAFQFGGVAGAHAAVFLDHDDDVKSTLEPVNLPYINHSSAKKCLPAALVPCLIRLKGKEVENFIG